MLTPPASPRSSTGSGSLASSISQCLDTTGPIYLRARHSYSPEASSNTGESASCLPLKVNTLIYIHSIHSSGWADGTLLTGQRGWFPSNYCEPYVLEVLLPLEQSRTALQEVVRLNIVAKYATSVAALVSSVRELLISTNCLTRDSPMVRQSDVVKRDRKALLSELSGLVNLTRRESLNLSQAGPDLVQRSCRILIRAGRFVHTIGPLSGLYIDEAAKLHSVEVTPTPPVSYDFSTPTIREEEEEEDHGEQEQTTTAIHCSEGIEYSSALKQLEATHEGLLSHLAAFIGRLHLQSQTQTANHILLATRQCVNAARALLASLEAICNYHADQTLSSAKDHLYTEITNLVTRAREVVETQHGVISDTRPLISAATGIVRGAGQCTSRARYMIETTGDFTLDNTDPEVDSVLMPLPRDDTSSSLASLIEQRASRDVQTQVESLAIPYKKIAQAEPRVEPAGALEHELKNHGSGPLLTDDAEATTADEEEPILFQAYSDEDVELAFNVDGQVTGGTLPALIARLTPHDNLADSVFYSAFFLTFRSFSSPEEIANLLISRFEWSSSRSESDASWDSVQGRPIRLRVYNVLKNWLESHWRAEEDSVAIPSITKFAQGNLRKALPQAGRRLSELVAQCQNNLTRRESQGYGRVPAVLVRQSSAQEVLPSPIVSKAQLTSLHTCAATDSVDVPSEHGCSVVDFDDLELARQLTLLDSKLFCAISPVELVNQEFSKKPGQSRAVNMKAMSTASTDLAGWVADTILWETEQKKRTAVLKQWIKVGERCAAMNNYNTLMAIMCALNSSTIARLKRTWDGLSRQQRAQLEHLRSVTDHQRNYAVYRSKIKQATLPCLPYLGLYRTDLTFIDEGNPSHRPSKQSDRSLINFDKHIKTAKVVLELQQFQTPYKFQEVPELSAWIMSSCLRVRNSATDLSGNLWRRSLIIEPKMPAMMRREPSVASSVESESKSNKFSFMANW